MKILHIFDHSIPLHSGYAFRSLALLRQQQAFGWQTVQLTSAKHGGGDAEYEVVDGLGFYRTSPLSEVLPSLPLLGQWAIIASLQRRLEQLVKQVEPDILHAHSPALNGMAALAVAKKYRIPLVYECRAFWEDAAVDHGKSRPGDMRYRLGRALENYVFKHADALVTICQGLRNDLIGRGIAADKISVVANGVDVEQFSFGEPAEPELQRQLQLQGMTVLGYFGSFYRYEGLLLLLDALPAVLEHQPNLRLLLAGGGPEQPQIEARIAELKLHNHVILLGRVPHQDMARYYNLVDILVYPRASSRLTELVTPLKPLEAMAQGRIVLAADVGGHKELIDDGNTGYLFKAGDREALAAKILELLGRRDDWERLRQAGRRYVEQQRNWRQSAECYRPLYEKLCIRR